MKYIGVDVGGTKISAVLIDQNGKVIKESVNPTQADMSEKIIIDNIVKTILAVNDKTVKKIGIGIPGVCNDKGIFTHIPNIPSLKNRNVKKILETKLKKKTIIENDANCFALAEKSVGIAKKNKNVIGLILGTGVGSGIIIDSKVYRGANGFAGEVGHIKTLSENNVEFEELLAGRGFFKKYKEAGGNGESMKEADKNSQSYRAAYTKWLDELEVFLSNLILSFDPEIIVVGGGLSSIDFYKDINEKLKKNPAIAFSTCKVVKNSLGADAGKIGAAMLTK